MKFLFPTFLIIISGIVFFVVINPLKADVLQLRDDVKVYNEALSNSKTLAETQDRLLASYKNIKQEDKDRLVHFLPSSVNNIKFILEAEQIASVYNMPIKDIKFETQKAVDEQATKSVVVSSNKIVDNSKYGVFPIEFKTEGKYSSFVLFLKDLERNLRLVDIESISFEVPANVKTVEGVDPNVYTYSLKVKIYWLK